MSNVTLVELSKPIRKAGREEKVLELREPLLSDIRALDAAKGEGEKLALLIRLLSGLTQREADEIASRDLPAIGEAIAGFFGGSLPTGAS